MAGPSEQQEKALRELLGLRTAPEWDREVQRLDRALVEGRQPELTTEEYDRLLAPVVRLRLRRALMHALERDCFYIGALGSKKTHARRLERLKQQGISDAQLARVHAPIGLPIGAISPPEIAVAIMGEITSRLRLTPEGKR